MDHRSIAAKERLSKRLADWGVFTYVYHSAAMGVSPTVTLACPGCSAERSVPVSNLKNAQSLICKSCRARVRSRETTSDETISARLAEEGATFLSRIYGATASQNLVVAFRCRCGNTHQQVWALLVHHKKATDGRLKAQCPDCKRQNHIEVSPFQPGPSHPNWNPDLTDAEREDRWHEADSHWARDVVAKTGGRCVITGVRHTAETPLAAHPLWSRTKFPQFRYDVNNGVALTRDLHRAFHQQFGRGWNDQHFTPQNFLQFFKQHTGLGPYIPKYLLDFIPL